MINLERPSKPIQLLPPYVANQIAAGEVIERPASVVKELIENSLDAGALQLDIDIEQGGLQCIQLRDNGCGIVQTELLLALERHSTNKIYQPEDIEHITSFGFRGEALASMSAVARVRLCSRTRQAPHAWETTVEPGQPPSALKPAAHPPGTTIEISELFHNTPARRRFLRSAQTEFGRIQTLVKCLSLGQFHFGLNLRHNRRLILTLPPSVDDQMHVQRMSAICGNAFAETAIPLDQKATGLRLWGWIGSANFSRSQADLQYFYVNGRLIRDKRLSYAVKQAYQDVLYHGRHPAVLLFFTIDPAEIDVNVHPTKAEVRFRQPHLIYDFTRRSLQQALAKGQWSLGGKQLPINPVMQTMDVSYEVKNKTPSYISESETTPVLITNALSQVNIQHNRSTFAEDSQLATLPVKAIPQAIEQFDLPQLTTTESPTSPSTLVAATPPLGYALAQLHGVYILAENQLGLMIVDAHAAHERILYEQFKQDIAKGHLQTQALLTPIILILSSEVIDLVDKQIDILGKIGVSCERVGPDSLAIHGIPTLLASHAVGELIQDVLTDLGEHIQSQRVESYLNTLLGNIACRSAIRAQRKMSIIEMNQLLRLMENTERSSYCNHGRPTWKQITLKALDSWFLRGR